MNSHEYAAELEATAKKLKASPVFELSHEGRLCLFFWSDKEKFLAAIRSLGTGKKEYSNDEVHFIPDGANLKVTAYRSAVCRKVQEEKWECEPLLSQDKELQIGGVPA